MKVKESVKAFPFQVWQWAFPLLWWPRAFTLVELIVVVTILAILATVWFASYTSHLSSVRDTTRINQLSLIRENLDLYRRDKKLPLPDDYIEVKANGVVIWYQWYAWKSVLIDINIKEWWKDPMDKVYYTYYITKKKKNFQLLSYLEEEQAISKTKENIRLRIQNKVQAGDIDYENRYIKVTWDKLWILTQSWTNTPVQEINALISSWYLDLWDTTQDYYAYFSDTKNISWSWTDLTILKPVSEIGELLNSCYKLLRNKATLKNNNWEYLLMLWWEIEKVYCDMTTDWGWWTMIASYVNWSFFNKCNTTYWTNCSTVCSEFSDDAQNCNEQSEYDIQDAELQILREKYIVSEDYWNVNNFTTNDYVSKSFYNTSFNEMMFKNDENEYITYNMKSVNTNSMSSYYNSIKNDEILAHRFQSYKTNITNISSINNCDTLEVAMHSWDNDWWVVNYAWRKYLYYSAWQWWPAWDAGANWWCHYDDSHWIWRTRKLWWSLNNVSQYIIWFVR